MKNVMRDPTELEKKEKVEVEQTVDTRVPARGLEGAYAEDEPEYTLDMLIGRNPAYEGASEMCPVSSRVPARGLAGACAEDEPECGEETG